MRLTAGMTIWVASLLSVCTVHAEEGGGARVTQTQAVKDATTLVQLLEISHPDPYINMGGMVAFHEKARALIKGLPPSGLTVEEFARRLEDFVSGLKDGHTRVNGPDTGKPRDTSMGMLVRFGISADGLFISGSNVPELAGTRGDRLLAVNGHPLEDIPAKTGAENIYGDYKQCASIVRSYKSLHDRFPDLDPQGAATFNLLSPDGVRVDRTIPWQEVRAVNDLPDERKQEKRDLQNWTEKPRRWNGLEPSEDLFSYRFFEKQGAAYFRIAAIMGRESAEMSLREKVGNPDWMIRDYYRRHNKTVPADPEEAIKGMPSFVETGERLLREMQEKGMTNLIVDLRGNGGGWTPMVFPFFYQMYGDAYYGHHSRSRFVTRVSQLFLDKHHMTLEEWRRNSNDPEFELGDYQFHEEENLGAEAARKKAIAEYSEEHLSFAKNLEALDGKPVFTPKRVIVLCDPDTFSAAFHTMAYLKEMGAILVGVPSSQSPNAFMEVTEFKLPESGLTGSISNSRQFFCPDDPKADVFHLDFEATYPIFVKYDFDEQTILRYALDLIADGKL
ncbi:MAG: S41 family peptidase [Verrucomicrobiia bacterium]